MQERETKVNLEILDTGLFRTCYIQQFMASYMLDELSLSWAGSSHGGGLHGEKNILSAHDRVTAHPEMPLSAHKYPPQFLLASPKVAVA